MAVSNVFDSVQFSSPADLEIVTIQLGCCRDLVLCTSYVPPNSSDTYLLALLNYFTDLLSTFHHSIFEGDFNFPNIDWSSFTAYHLILTSFMNLFLTLTLFNMLTPLLTSEAIF